jgi:hypothetical protein
MVHYVAGRKCGCGFAGPSGYVGPTFADGNNFNFTDS